MAPFNRYEVDSTLLKDTNETLIYIIELKEASLKCGNNR